MRQQLLGVGAEIHFYSRCATGQNHWLKLLLNRKAGGECSLWLLRIF